MDEGRTSAPERSRSGGKRWRWGGVGWPRAIGDHESSHVAVAILVALTIWGYADIAPHARLIPRHPDKHKTDFTVFTEAGAAFFDGRDPYAVTNPRGWHYLYPPLFALLVAPLGALDTESQAIVWYVLSIALAFGCYGEARRLWRLIAPPREPAPPNARVVGAFALTAVLLPSLDCLQRGQLGIALLYALMLGFRLVVEGRSRASWLLGGLILAVPTVIKLIPALPVGLLVLQRWAAAAWPTRRGGRPAAQAGSLSGGLLAGVCLGVLLIPASLVGWQKNLDYLQRWARLVVANERVGMDHNFDVHSVRNQSLANAVHLLGSPPRLLIAGRGAVPLHHSESRVGSRVVSVTIAGVLAAVVALGLTVGRRDDPLDQAAAFGLACWATLIVSPLAWGHYYMMELPAMICIPCWLAARRRPWGLLMALPVVLCWGHYLRIGILGPRGALGLGTAFWFLCVCGSILIAEAARPDEAAAPVPARRRCRTAPLLAVGGHAH